MCNSAKVAFVRTGIYHTSFLSRMSKEGRTWQAWEAPAQAGDMIPGFSIWMAVMYKRD